MAVKTSWSSGDVLTAADLTDTFAAKGDVSGETWTGTHDFSGATVTGIPAGLTLLSTTSFSAVASVSIDNVFSSDHRDYRILLRLLGSTTGVSVLMRMCASGSDATGADYHDQRMNASGTTVSAVRSSAQTSWSQGPLAVINSGYSTASFDLVRPFEAAETSYNAHGMYRGGVDLRMVSGFHALSNSYDGVTIWPTSGTIAGDISVYGYGI